MTIFLGLYVWVWAWTPLHADRTPKTSASRREWQRRYYHRRKGQ